MQSVPPSSTDTPRQKDNILFTCVSLLLILLMGVICTQPLWSNDLWWHLSYGRYIWEHGSIPVNDVFTWTHAGQPTAYVPWLSSTLFYITHLLFGAPGLVGLKGVIASTCIGLTYLYNRQRHVPSVWFVVIAVFAIWLLDARLVLLRAQVTPFLLLPVLFILWEKGKDNAWSIWRWCIPLVIVVWVNSHGSFPVPLLWLGLSLTWPLLWDLQKLKREWVPNLLLLFAAIVATCVTPTGTTLWKTVLTLIFSGKSTIMSSTQEVLPIHWYELYGLQAPAGALGLLAIAAIFGSEWKKRGHEHLFFLFVFWMAMGNRRFIGYVGLIGLLYIPHWLYHLIQTPQARRQKGAVYLLGLASFAILAYAPFWSYQYQQGKYNIVMERPLHFFADEQIFPATISDFLKTHTLKGKMYNEFSEGGYLYWKVPSYKVFIDGRTNILFKEAFFYENYFRHRGKTTLLNVLNRWNISFAILRHGKFASVLYNTKDWIPLVFDDFFVLFVKRGTGNDVLIEKYQYKRLRVYANGRVMMGYWAHLRRNKPLQFEELCLESTRALKSTVYKSKGLRLLGKLCHNARQAIQPIRPAPTKRPTTSPTTKRSLRP